LHAPRIRELRLAVGRPAAHTAAAGNIIEKEGSRMSSSMRLATRSLGLTLAALPVLAAAAATSAAATPDHANAAALQPIEELQELDQVWIRGKSLSDMIEDAEDTFVRRYNKVNKKNDFDVVCDYLRLNRDSLALTRTCVPYFIGYLSTGTAAPWTPTYACTGSFMASGSVYGDSFADMGNGYYSNYGTSCSYAGSPAMPPMSTPTIVRLPAKADYESQRQEYMRTVMRAIYRDQDLLDKATTLAAMYQEMKTVQDHYQKVKAEDDARKAEERRLHREQRRLHLTPAPANKGPRI
jgi:hypothetical protein